MSLLKVEDVVTAYGKIEALKGVSLEVAEGTITCLLGPNGAGKTTLMMTLAGILKPRRGRVLLGGADIAGQAPHAIVKRGIALVPENRLVFPAMSVLENLQAGAYQRADKRAVGEDIDNLSLSDRRAQTVAQLLTDEFGVPPENLTVQGYGEQYLKVETEGPERQNRRVTVRRITPLIGQNQAGPPPQ